jgi:tetratricopeptide (TPR) repeat protein
MPLMTCTDIFSNPDLLVFFVDASSDDRIKEDYQSIIRSRGIAYRSSTYQGALQWFASTDTPWLIIADNVDDPGMDLQAFVPRSSHGHFIITSRNRNQALMARKNAHHIDALAIDDSVKLLLNVSGYEPIDINVEYATNIVNKLGCLPLAVVQAAAYIYKLKCLPTYLDIYNENREKLLVQRAKELPHGYDLSVATTLEISFYKLPIRSQQALCILSFLQTTSIAHEIIETAARNRFFYASGRASEADKSRESDIRKESGFLCKIFCHGGQWSELEFNEIIEPCFQYSLLQCTTPINGQKFYSMHILTQTWLQMQPNFTGQPSPKLLAKRMLLAVVREGSLYEHISLHMVLLPHLRTFAGQPFGVATDDALLYRVLTDYKDDWTAMIHMESYMSLINSALESNSLERLKGIRDLMWSLVQTGRGHEAVNTGKESMEIFIQSLGREDPITLSFMSNLARAHSSLGEFENARDMDQQTLALRKKVLGPEHPHTLVSMNNLSHDYRRLGVRKKARELDEQTLALRRRVLGREHPDTLISMNNLSYDYGGLGEYEKARELDEQTLALRRRVLGPEHPATLNSMSNLAYSFTMLGEHEKSRELCEQILALRRRLLGPEHPNTLTAMRNLAWELSEIGEHEKARKVRLF